ncbi:MAG: S1 RNA-binding domain-containing protein [Bdellovibrionota bacterium]
MRDLFDDDNDEKKSSDFAQMFEDSMGGVGKKLSVGDKIRSEVLSVGKEEVFVSTGTVDDGIVLKLDLANPEGEVNVKVGEFLDLYVTKVSQGQLMLSPKPTSKNLSDDLEDAFDMELPVEGRVTEVVNGGFRISVLGKTAFCPISQLDSRRIEDGSSYIGKKFDFLVTQFDSRGKNIVVSRRKLLDSQKEASTAAFAEDHKPGDLLRGVITRLEAFGAFVEIAPGLEGLCHISELSYSRVTHPREAVQIGQDVSVKILKIEEGMNGRMNVSLSIKQAAPTPWENLPSHVREGDVVEGRVTRCMKFGAFVEIAPGIEGLVPLSEMSYAKRVLRAEEIVNEGDRINVLIKELREDDQRILLSIKDAGGDPFALFVQNYPAGSMVKGVVEKREPYGLFIKLTEGVTGLLPKSKANEVPDFPFDKLKAKDEVTVQISEIRHDERKIALSPPGDADAGAWKDFSTKGGGAAAKSLGTLGEQFKGLFDAKTDKK